MTDHNVSCVILAPTTLLQQRLAEQREHETAAKLALILCITLDKKFEELFYFD